MNKKQRIMAAAETLVKTGQFHEITLNEIAKRADVGKGTIYEYFPSKDELFFQTAIAAYDQMCELLRQSIAEQCRIQERLERACATISSFVMDHRPLFRLMHAQGELAQGKGGKMWERWMRHRKGLSDVIAEVIRTASERGEVRPAASAEAMAEYFIGMIRTQFNELEGLSEKDRSHRTLVALFLHGLMCSTPAPSANKHHSLNTRPSKLVRE